MGERDIGFTRDLDEHQFEVHQVPRYAQDRPQPRPPLGSPLPLLWPHRDAMDRRPVLGSIPEPEASVALLVNSIRSTFQLASQR